MPRRLLVALVPAMLMVACSGPIEDVQERQPAEPVTTVEIPLADDALPLAPELSDTNDQTTETADAPLTVDQPEVLEVPELPPAEPVTIVATGDMMLGGSGTEFYERDNYDYAFKNVKDILVGADVFIGNLETALTTSDEVLVEKKYRFKNPPEPVAAAQARAGMDVANLANNHSLDFGYVGLTDTRQALIDAGIDPIGAGRNLSEARRAAIVDVRDTRIAFLGYSNTFPEEFWAESNRPGTAFGHEHQIRDDVRQLKTAGVDVVVVSFYWGREGTTELREYQPLLAHAAIDAGASVVIGHHPHVLKAVERYKEGVIFYSLGNFTFGSYSRRARDSAIARIHILEGDIDRVELLPINVLNVDVLFQPVLLDGIAAGEVIAGLQALSAERKTILAVDQNRAVLEWSANLSSN